MKRFSETQKWSDPWFRKLSMEAKMLWLWLLDNCDCAGIIEPDWDLARFQIGAKEDLGRSLEALGNRVEMRGGKLFIPKFVKYQYGESLNPENNAHKGVLKRLFEIEQIPCNSKENKDLISPCQGAVEGLHSPPRIGIRKGKGSRTGTRPNLEEIKEFVLTLKIPESEAIAIHGKWEANNFTNGGKPIADWKATIRNWNNRGFLDYQKPGYRPPVQAGQEIPFSSRSEGEEWTDAQGNKWTKIGGQALKHV